MLRHVLIGLCLLCTMPASAQLDSVPYRAGFPFNKGVYLTFEQFKANAPLPYHKIERKDIVSMYNGESFKFRRNYFRYRDANDSLRKVKVLDTWGYSNGMNVYVNPYASAKTKPINSRHHQFCRLQVTGAAGVFSQFYLSSHMGSNRSSAMPRQQLSESSNEWLVSLKTGQCYRYSVDNLLILLQDDPTLLTEFEQMIRTTRRPRDQIMVYVRKYNKRHPLHFPAAVNK